MEYVYEYDDSVPIMFNGNVIGFGRVLNEGEDKFIVDAKLWFDKDSMEYYENGKLACMCLGDTKLEEETIYVAVQDNQTPIKMEFDKEEE